MRKPMEAKLNLREITFTVLLVVLALLPHLLHLNVWISGFFAATLALRLVAMKYPKALPGRFLLFLLTIGGIANVLAHYPIFIGKTAGVALLCSMLGLKLLELKSRRDLFVTVFLGYFVLVTQFLFRQEIGLVLYVFVIVCGFTALLIEASRSEHSGFLLKPLRHALWMLLQATPIMLALFLFFPRLGGPLWNLGIDAGAGVTGLSDRITPGSISQLIRSKAVAFRADFEDPIPPSPKRYWRGPVLWETDGYSWTEGDRAHPRRLEFRAWGAPTRYSITQEPSRRNWLFTLDIPGQISRKATMLPDFQILSEQPLNQRVRYSAISHTEYNTGAIKPTERTRALQLPPNITPRMLDLVDQWQQAAPDRAAVVTEALQHFRQQPFYYTLYPPQLENNPVDEFLFESRRGFCEHYATSFTLLMRLAGIPSRVVTGYQGGELNPLGDYLIVRQSDAHAWSEVWLEGRGWVRVDPTAAVAPERVERPFEPEIDETLGLLGTPIDFTIPESDLLRQLIKRLRWGVDSINSSWHLWVLGYSNERQSQLMDMLGLGFLQGYKLALGMILITGLVVLALTALLWNRTKEKRDPVQRDYLHFCRRLERFGISREPWQGPKDFAHQIIQQRPDLQAEVARIIGLYVAIRYGRKDSPHNRKQLKQRISAFRP